jgi:hypothetical protein
MSEFLEDKKEGAENGALFAFKLYFSQATTGMGEAL